MIYNSFEKTYNQKDNAIGFIRLVLSIFVIIQHCFALINQSDPLSSIGFVSFGALGVNSFFILSGFLITASWLNSKSLLNYLWSRALRIFPAFWICLIFTAFGIAPLITILRGQDFNMNLLINQATYVLKNFVLIINQPSIGNITNGLSEKSLNGSLWTLSWEFLLYILLAIGGLFGALSKRKWLLIGITAIYILSYWADACKCSIFLKLYTSSNVAILPYYFLVGTLGFLFKKYIPDSKILLICCILLWIIDLKFNFYYPLHPFFLFYILIWLVTHLPFKSIEKYGDFSYGIYIYHFIVIQTLNVYDKNQLGPLTLFFITLPISFLLAYLSWNYIEKKCLNSKNIFK